MARSTGPLTARPMKAVTAVAARSTGGCSRISLSVSISETTSSGTPCPRSPRKCSTARLIGSRDLWLFRSLFQLPRLLLFGSTSLLILLARYLRKHELQPFAQLGHDASQPPGA